MRHALAHLLEGKSTATEVDLDTWKFLTAGGTVSFDDLEGFTYCLSDLLEYATAHAGRIVREDKRIHETASISVRPREPE
jgi:hypothetical protein